MSLNYSISTRHETADTIPNIDNYRGKTPNFKMNTEANFQTKRRLTHI